MLRPLALLLLTLTPASAQDPAWPPAVISVIDQARSDCDGDFSVAPEAVTQRDLNGDTAQDWIVDASGFACSSSYGIYCGTEGCMVDTLIDGIRGSFLLHEWDTVTEGGVTYLTAPNALGGTARFLWTGTQWELQ
ncbi:hypothetical protein [Tabrizicola sp.]|uniref:hypothetical protein n=1 Tax=Tabrizicola sp. TaxID=2005166 RepID=UPI003F3BCFB0